MTSIVQISDFEGELEIVNKDKPGVEAELNWFICKYEPIILQQLLGDTLLAQLSTGAAISPPAEQWMNLVKRVKPALLGFIYYWYMRKNFTQTSSIGEVKGKSQNSTTASMSDKMVQAWNDSVSSVYHCADYIANNSEFYGNYYLSIYNYPVCGWQSRRLPEIFTKINVLNI